MLVRMEGIVKRFPGVLANDGVDFDIRPGEIHTLLGENGAGKSTLMSVLAGAYHPDAGSIFIGGKKVVIHSPRDAIRAGVGMVHQHFMLVSSYTVAENATLGLNKPRFLIRSRSLEKDVAEKAQTYGLQVDPSAKIWQLSVGEQQRVEILKMLYRGVKILILDEPTAVLTPQEVDEFFVTLRRMAAAGQGIVFISHKMDEVMRISDRITVMRKGKKIATVAAKETTARDLAIMMVGREVLFQLDKADKPTGQEVLSLQGIWSLSDKRLPALRGLSLSLRAGEILGIAGVAGNGQRELAETITGLRPVTKGRILVNQKDMTNKKPLEMIERGVAHVPEDRKGTGTIPNLAVLDNLMLKCYRYPPFSSGPFLNLRQIRSHAGQLVKRFHITTPSLETETKLLSGGNVQRLILAREIATASELMVAVHPTRGLDIGATESVHQMLIEQRNNGGAILLISEDLDEILSLADRVAVIYEGQITGQMAAKDAKIEDVGLMMAGKTMEASPGETT
ncbi:MAG: ABC transporter ATP-binding protein [Coprothermobacterota bacterium]|nr:ABC transporter ATP-binding protein [Coprothermobacterota bacterium]